MPDLLTQSVAFQPLAARMRPRTLAEFCGQSHVIASGRALHRAISNGSWHSMIFWGPPGCGKTTLAELICQTPGVVSEKLSAVLSGVKDIREVMARARTRRLEQGQRTLLFVDEIHRFNKTQQDAFLPPVEQGDIILLGATTENPSFQLQNALLSRCRVYVLKPHTQADLAAILDQALQDPERGLGELDLQLPPSLREKLLHAADGDARQLLNLLEILSDFAKLDEEGRYTLQEEQVSDILRQSCRHFDHGGDIFYQQISALHKSIRGSDPDAALYWLARMFDGGCDPQYVARRLLRVAYEDIGLADPRATRIVLDAWQSYERLGQTEGELALVQATVYLACAAKSNAVYKAHGAVKEDVEAYGQQPVPAKLCNASTLLQKSLGYGKDCRYPHDESSGFVAGECYFPEKMPVRQYYHPVQRGLERKIADKLQWLRDKT